MPQFFFNYRSGGIISEDEIGTEFPSLEAAYLDTCKSALAIAFEKLRARQDPTSDAFDIVDDQRNVLMHVPFSEVLRPGGTVGVSSRMQQAVAALERCSFLMSRGEKLKKELRAEVAKTKELFHAIRSHLPTSLTP